MRARAELGGEGSVHAGPDLVGHVVVEETCSSVVVFDHEPVVLHERAELGQDPPIDLDIRAVGPVVDPAQRAPEVVAALGRPAQAYAEASKADLGPAAEDVGVEANDPAELDRLRVVVAAVVGVEVSLDVDPVEVEAEAGAVLEGVEAAGLPILLDDRAVANLEAVVAEFGVEAGAGLPAHEGLAPDLDPRRVVVSAEGVIGVADAEGAIGVRGRDAEELELELGLEGVGPGREQARLAAAIFEEAQVLEVVEAALLRLSRGPGQEHRAERCGQ